MLGSLAKEPASGYDLVRRFDTKLNFVWWASHGAVYTELQKLEAEGLITSSDEGARGRIEYAVTEAGHDAVRAWLTSPVARRPKDELILRIFHLWLLEPADAADFLDGLATEYRDRLALYESRAASAAADPSAGPAFFDAIALRAGIHHERAMLAWAEEAAAAIRASRG
jgi:PadR family transcriptional regulator, regulatory protein AphA